MIRPITLALFWIASITLFASPALAEGFPLILYYHQFTKSSAKAFRSQLTKLLGSGYKPITSEELVRALAEGKPLPAKSVMIHIDDVYETAYQYAVPILREKGVKAEFFAHTHFVGSNQNSAKMSWTQLRELENDELFTVYSHTWTHPDLRKVSTTRGYAACDPKQTQLESELKLPLKELIENLEPKRKPEILAYPMGLFNQKVVDAAKKDYLIAYATETPWINADHDKDWLYKIPREKMEPNYSLENTIKAYEKRSSGINLNSASLQLSAEWKSRALKWLHNRR